MKSAKSRGTRKASRTRKVPTYDLHNHVIPENVVQAIERNPERYGTRIEVRDGKR